MVMRTECSPLQKNIFLTIKFCTLLNLILKKWIIVKDWLYSVTEYIVIIFFLLLNNKYHKDLKYLYPVFAVSDVFDLCWALIIIVKLANQIFHRVTVLHLLVLFTPFQKYQIDFVLVIFLIEFNMKTRIICF